MRDLVGTALGIFRHQVVYKTNETGRYLDHLTSVTSSCMDVSAFGSLDLIEEEEEEDVVVDVNVTSDDVEIIKQPLKDKKTINASYKPLSSSSTTTPPSSSTTITLKRKADVAMTHSQPSGLFKSAKTKLETA